MSNLMTKSPFRVAFKKKTSVFNFTRKLSSKNNSEQHDDSYVPRRALLYVPGSNKKMLEKAANIEVDCLVLELEDGVALTAKEQARDNLRQYLDDLTANKRQRYKCQEVGVRVNSVSSGLILQDVMELSKAANLPDAFMVPKVDSVKDLEKIRHTFLAAYGESRCLGNSTRLVIWIESARAILNMENILTAAVNMHKSSGFFKTDAVVFGSDDYCADIGATRTNEAGETFMARQRLVACCKAFAMQAIDSVFIDYKDLKTLRSQCEQGRDWGFDGKQTIHPGQIQIVQDTFTPNHDRVEWARALIGRFEEHEKTGTGAFTFEGRMVDRPLLLQAANILALLRRVSLRSGEK